MNFAPGHVQQMRAVEISGPDVMRLTCRPIPAPCADEVLIRVHAAGVNGHDIHHRHRGSHPIDADETDLPGLEVAGEIVGLGSDVEGFSLGDAVCALVRGGGYAEFCVAKAAQCLPVPHGYSWVEAASLPEACFTVYSNVFVDAALQPDESFLMNGGTSGIGVTAIQMVSALGHRVFATARGPEKCATCEKLGAVRAIDYTSEDFAEIIAAETNGGGVDVILDIVGGDYIAKDLQALANDGRLAVIGAARGANVEIDLVPMVRKRLRLSGSTLRPRSPKYKAEIANALRQRVWPLFENGRISAVVDSTFHLEQVDKAHERLESRAHIGKVVLTLD